MNFQSVYRFFLGHSTSLKLPVFKKNISRQKWLKSKEYFEWKFSVFSHISWRGNNVFPLWLPNSRIRRCGNEWIRENAITVAKMRFVCWNFHIFPVANSLWYQLPYFPLNGLIKTKFARSLIPRWMDNASKISRISHLFRFLKMLCFKRWRIIFRCTFFL